jgi:hypothetical protein
MICYYLCCSGNWLGILSRGVLPPKRVTTLGVKRTDEGLLGAGMYFGETAATSAKYSAVGQKGYRMMLVATVALGNIKDYHQPNPDLTKPPLNFHRCAGLRACGVCGERVSLLFSSETHATHFMCQLPWREVDPVRADRLRGQRVRHLRNRPTANRLRPPVPVTRHLLLLTSPS